MISKIDLNVRMFVLAKSFGAKCPLLCGRLGRFFGSFIHSNESLSWKSSHLDISGNKGFKPEPKVSISSPSCSRWTTVIEGTLTSIS